ncbi:Type II toxin-antitoxin system VapC family toxin [Sulfidibacter corallicola]|uniref:Type II toxin-antitoxin system VapC family toxin n=2 Tax=Sulfidibacter corallicola TaxID=2818388 RepID=A0A8A4TSS9_SULCO|nr:type II toxin-antitoxin system VapC family toxin [Sulfidibacter corallicola]QTD52101.1 type II toxin-antitoxin system VapC family toxin [Sulfidibacter corallicola]
MMYILDTNVVSELRKARTGKADPAVVAWAESVPPSLQYLSVITILELEMGIAQIERRDHSQGLILKKWLKTQILTAFQKRILHIDLLIARRCGRLPVPDPRSDRDALIAATALVHGMTVVTRNIDDFSPTGVPVLNPWESK